MGAESRDKMGRGTHKVFGVRAEEQDVIHVVIYGNRGIKGAKGINIRGNIDLTEGGAVCHALRQNFPLVSSCGARGIGWE